MIEDLMNQNTICSPDVSRIGKEIKTNQANHFSYPKRKFGKQERNLLPAWYEKWTWLHLEEDEDHILCITTQKMKFSIQDIFSKCDQIRSFLRIWSHLLKKALIENFIFCALRHL